MTHLKYIKYKIFTALLVVILTACSSGSDSSENTPNPTDGYDYSNLTEEEKVLQQELNLPPKPDEELAKIEFIDVNANEIRDDVEWYIAKTHYSTENGAEKVRIYNSLAILIRTST